MTTTTPILEAQMACAELRQTWLDANPRPNPRDREAVWDFHCRWLESDARAECERIMAAALATVASGSVSRPSEYPASHPTPTLPQTPNKREIEACTNEHHARAK